MTTDGTLTLSRTGTDFNLLSHDTLLGTFSHLESALGYAKMLDLRFPDFHRCPRCNGTFLGDSDWSTCLACGYVREDSRMRWNTSALVRQYGRQVRAYKRRIK